jgi:ribosomal protein S26
MKHGEAAQCTFKPEINITSEIICESDPKRGNETLDKKISRLYYEDQKKKEVLRELKEAEIYAEYTFKPTINKNSKTMVDD